MSSIAYIVDSGGIYVARADAGIALTANLQDAMVYSKSEAEAIVQRMHTGLTCGSKARIVPIMVRKMA